MSRSKAATVSTSSALSGRRRACGLSVISHSFQNVMTFLRIVIPPYLFV